MTLQQGSSAIVTTATDPLNLRGHPNKTGTIVNEIKRHGLVRIDGPIDGGFWPVTVAPEYLVHAGVGQGYAADAYLTEVPVGAPVPVPDDPAPNAPAADDQTVVDGPPADPSDPSASLGGGSSTKKKIIIGATIVGAAAAVVTAMRSGKSAPRRRAARR